MKGLFAKYGMVRNVPTLAANTALSGALVGTPVSPALAADSLLFSNKVASGDILAAANRGGNSYAWLWVDSSASLLTLFADGVSALELAVLGTVVNEGAADRDFRIETLNLSNGFVVDGGSNNFAFGGAVDASVFVSIAPNARNATPGVNLGYALDIAAATITDNVTAASGTAAAATYVNIAAPTYAATNTAVTMTNAATLYISGPPVAGTNVTISNAPWSIWIGSGASRFDGGLKIVNALITGETGSLSVGGSLNIGASDWPELFISGAALTATANIVTTRLVRIDAPSYVGDVATRTMTNAATFYVQDAPSAGANAAITNAYCAWFDAGQVRIDGNTVLNLIAYTWPAAGGTAGQQLQTDGATPQVLSWAAAGSLAAYKELIGLGNPAEALSAMISATVHRFHYRPDAEISTRDLATEYMGVIAEDAPWAMHHNGHILNPINTFGYTVLAVQALYAKIAELEGRLQSLLERI